MGIGMGPLDYNSKAGFTGDARFPLGRHLDALVQGLDGSGKSVVQWSTAFALRYSFGKP